MDWEKYRRRFFWSGLVGAIVGLIMVAALVLQQPSALDSDSVWQWLPLMLLIFISSFSVAGLLLFGLLPITFSELLIVFKRKTRDVDWASIAKPLITFMLCLPLFIVCLIGDSRYDYPGLRSITFFGFLLLLIIFLPAVVVHISAHSPRFQNVVFVLFLAVATVEFVTGITPTSQLTHEGTDILWFFVHLLFGAMAGLAYCAFKVANMVVGKDDADE